MIYICDESCKQKRFQMYWIIIFGVFGTIKRNIVFILKPEKENLVEFHFNCLRIIMDHSVKLNYNYDVLEMYCRLLQFRNRVAIRFYLILS